MKNKIIVLLSVIITVLLVGFKVYANTSENYIEKLETEVNGLSDKTIVYEEISNEVSISMIESSIQNIGELVTSEYLYTDVEKYENTRDLFGIELPFTEKTVIMQWDGDIKAGINVDNIEVELDVENKKIIIHMPEVEILSHEISDINVIDEKDGLFNNVNMKDIESLNIVNKTNIEDKAINKGLLENAYSNAKTIIEKLVFNDIVKEQGYKLEFK